ncbi:helix-turn-helix transcriptional regulator [Methylobacterium sp. A54F]
MRPFSADALADFSLRLGEVVVDPLRWTAMLDALSELTGSAGGALLQSDVRTADIPRSAVLEPLFRRYFGEGWHVRDLRARGVELVARGIVVGDDDLMTEEEMRREPYYADLLAPAGYKWFAGIGFRAGAAPWVLTLQRTAGQGAFTRGEKAVLAGLSDRLSEVATLSEAVGRASLLAMGSAFDAVRQPAILLQASGTVLLVNAAADALLRDALRVVNRRLVARERRVAEALDALTGAVRTRIDGTPLNLPPLVVPRPGRRPLVVRAVAVDGEARSPFLGARAVLLLTDLDAAPEPRAPDRIRAAFGLSPAEARLAARLAAGASLQEAADALGVTHATARGQLKAVLAKTGTHRQSALIELVHRLPP